MNNIMSSIEYDVFTSIQNIDSVSIESEMRVMEALVDAYEKQMMILENYEGSEEDAINLFQEGFFMEAKGDFKYLVKTWAKVVFKWIKTAINSFIDNLLAIYDNLSYKRLIKRLESMDQEIVELPISHNDFCDFETLDTLIDNAEKFVDILKSFDFAKFNNVDSDGNTIESEFEKIKSDRIEIYVKHSLDHRFNNDNTTRINKNYLIELFKKCSEAKFMNKAKRIMKKADFDEKEFLDVAEKMGYGDTVNSEVVRAIKQKAKEFAESFVKCGNMVKYTYIQTINFVNTMNAVDDTLDAYQNTRAINAANSTHRKEKKQANNNPKPAMA